MMGKYAGTQYPSHQLCTQTDTPNRTIQMHPTFDQLQFHPNTQQMIVICAHRSTKDHQTVKPLNLSRQSLPNERPHHLDLMPKLFQGNPNLPGRRMRLM
jgi:hypothetical protein